MNEQNRVSLKEKWKRYRLNHSAQSIAASAALYLLLFLCAMAIFLPSIWAVMTSFKEETEVLDANVTLFPKKYILDNYRHILSNHNVPIFRWFFNSFKIAVTYVVLYLLISSMAAFAFSRLKFKGRDAMFWLGMSSMVIPGVINMIPHYIIIDKLGLVDNMFAMVLPGLGGVGGVFLLRQFMKGVPMAYDEAAKIDGAQRVSHLLVRRSAHVPPRAGHAGDLLLSGQLERLCLAVDRHQFGAVENADRGACDVFGKLCPSVRKTDGGRCAFGSAHSSDLCARAEILY